MKQKKVFVWFIAALFVLSTVGVVWGQAVTVNGTVTKIEDEGKTITFKTEKGDTVKSTVSSKRTSIRKGDAPAKASDIKEGTKITITYTPEADKNEASLIKIIP